MAETMNVNTETVKNETPRPGTKDALKAENEALKAELEAMKAQQAKVDDTESKTEAEAPAVVEAPKEKMVKIRIPRTKADQEDVFVSVNLRTWLIKRGVEVEVPECVAEVLRHQEEMMEEIMLFEEKAQHK